MKKMNIEILKTQKFGKLTIVGSTVSRKTKNGNSVRRVEAICDCGVSKEYDLRSIVIGKTKSCGCIVKSGSVQLEYEHKKDGLYLCTKCKIYKGKEEFFKFLEGSNTSSKAYIIRRDGLRNECKQCFKDRRRKEDSVKSPRDNLRSLVNGAKTRARHSGLQFNITLDFIRSMFDRQNGCCNITGIPFELNLTKGKNNKSASIDRINPNKGYTIDNVQLVCTQVNMMKSNLSMVELQYFCKKVLDGK